MILKSFLVEKNISIINQYPIVLFYGENIGLKDDFKFEIRKKYNDFEKISFNQDEILKNENLLDEQIYNVSLFNKNKIIFINAVSEKLRSKLEKIIEGEIKDTKIFLFADIFEKKSSLRSIFEKSKQVGIIACYQDNQRTLSDYLRKKLIDFKGLSQETINNLIENSGMDRKVLQNEIDKITSFFLDKKIDTDKLQKLMNYAYNIDFQKLRDPCLEGDKKKLNQNLGNVSIKNEDIYFYIADLNLRFKKLTELREGYKIFKDMDVAADNIKPKIFWKDKETIIRQAKKWNFNKLEKAKSILRNGEIVMKTKMNNYNHTFVKNMLLDLCIICNSTS